MASLIAPPASWADAVSFAGLRARLDKLAPRYPVLGFDIFNTLLLRRVEGEWLKRAVAQKLLLNLQEVLHPSRWPTLEQVCARRTELESQVARERVARGEDNEVDYREMVPRWVATWVTTEPLRSQLIAAVWRIELDLERRALVAAPGMADLLRHLRDVLGRRLIFASDMYLPAVELRQLLDNQGLGQYFAAGYSSTDLGLRKATGRLFPALLRREKLKPDQLLFVGDDSSSDYRMPRSHGIAALQIVDPVERQRRRRLDSLERATIRNPYWSGHLVSEVMGAATAPRPRHDASYQVGWTLGPTLVAFTLQLLEQCRRQGITQVCFLAREGLTLQRVYQVLRESGEAGPFPEDRYLYFSRASTLLPSMKELSWEEIHRFSRQYSRQSLRSLLKNLSLPEAIFLPIAQRYGITEPDRELEHSAHNLPFQRFLASKEAHREFTHYRDRARQLLRRYLEQEGLLRHRKVAFVDIGWKGSIQDNVAWAMSEVPGFPELHGFYVGFVDDHGRVNPPRSFKYGVTADTRRHQVEEHELFRNSAIFEMVTTADHGTTLSYKVEGDQVVPVLHQHELEKENAQVFFSRAQRALLDYTRGFAEIHPLLPFNSGELKPAALETLLRYIRYPTRAEAKEFLRYSHVESFGVDQITTFGLGIPLRSLAKQPWRAWKTVKQAFKENMWKEGVVRRGPIPLGPFLYDLYRSSPS